MKSIEEKAKAYDKALEKARQLCAYPTSKPFISDLQDLFPELKEREDEKIRKDMIDTIKQEAQGFPSSIIAEKSNKWIAWLEKQGKQKPAQKQNMVVPLFRVGDTIRVKNSDAKYTITDISDGYYRGKGWCLDIVEGDASGDYELVERESMWSEKDEARLSVAIDCCERGGKNAIGNWLKSLRPQTTWKPSELQIEALESATENCAYSEYQDCLRQLIEQLKILKE